MYFLTKEGILFARENQNVNLETISIIFTMDAKQDDFLNFLYRSRNQKKKHNL